LWRSCSSPRQSRSNRCYRHASTCKGPAEIGRCEWASWSNLCPLLIEPVFPGVAPGAYVPAVPVQTTFSLFLQPVPNYAYPSSGEITLTATRPLSGSPWYRATGGQLRVTQFSVDPNASENQPNGTCPGGVIPPAEITGQVFNLVNPPGLSGGFVTDNLFAYPDTTPAPIQPINGPNPPQFFVTYGGLYFVSGALFDC
jgi:hypothetical protein